MGLKLNKELKGEKCLATVMLVTMEDIRQDKEKRMAVTRCPVIHRILLITGP